MPMKPAQCMSQMHTRKHKHTQGLAYNVIMSSTNSNYTKSVSDLSAGASGLSGTAQGNTERA